MKKGLLLKLFVGAGLFMFAGFSAFAQVKDANLSVDETIEQYVTINKAMPYHVTPDSYFNPGYIAPGWNVASDFLWSFTVNPATFTISDATVINPDINIGSIGDFTLNVVETSADGCPDATPTQLLIHVLAAPTFGFGGVADVEQCGPIVAPANVLFNITNNGADAVDGTGNYLVDWTYLVENMLADKVTVDGAALTNTTNTDISFTTSGAAKVLVNQAFPVLNNKVTRYTFTLNGINDAVSRASDYIAPMARNIAATNFTNYTDLTDNTYVVMVLPAPTTGPIYHLPNL